MFILYVAGDKLKKQNYGKRMYFIGWVAGVSGSIGLGYEIKRLWSGEDKLFYSNSQ